MLYYLKKRKTKKILAQTWNATFVVQLLSVNLMATVSLSAPSLMDVAQHFGKSMSITISLISGPFDDILTWPFKGTIQVSVFRLDNSGSIWTNLLKTNDETTPCFSRPSPLQPNSSCGIFYLLHEEMFKTDKNLMKNNNIYIQIKILDFA